MMLNKKSAMKAVFIMTLVDGEASVREVEAFGKIWQEILEDTEGKEAIMGESSLIAEGIEDSDEIYDVYQEALDVAIADKTDDAAEGITAEQLLWNMVTVASEDGGITQKESRLINHVARVLGVDRENLVVMKDLTGAISAAKLELETMEQSRDPYVEVRPRVKELEKQILLLEKKKKSILSGEADGAAGETDGCAEGASSDDADGQTKDSATGSKSFWNTKNEDGKSVEDTLNEVFTKTTKTLNDKVIPGAKDLGEKTYRSAKDVAHFLGDNADKFFSKVKETVSSDKTAAEGEPVDVEGEPVDVEGEPVDAQEDVVEGTVVDVTEETTAENVDVTADATNAAGSGAAETGETVDAADAEQNTAADDADK